MEDWSGRVMGVVIALDGHLSVAAVNQARDLIDHGEAPEGLISLAWCIVAERARVPRWTVDAIHELGDGVNDPADLPENLREFAD